VTPANTLYAPCRILRAVVGVKARQAEHDPDDRVFVMCRGPEAEDVLPCVELALPGRVTVLSRPWHSDRGGIAVITATERKEGESIWN
jgi:hypothetical protein